MIIKWFKSLFKKKLKHQWIIRHDRATDSMYFGPFKSMTEAEAFIFKFENFGKKIHDQVSWVLPLETSLSVQKMLGQLQISH